VDSDTEIQEKPVMVFIHGWAGLGSILAKYS